MSANLSTVLVTGASGKLGRRVLELLLEGPHGTVIAATRSPEKLADFAAKGVVVRAADFTDEASLEAAFAGVDRLLLISTDSFDGRLEQQTAAVEAAEKAGVRHIVYTSITNAGPDAIIIATPSHHGTEQAIIDSGMGYTLLRNNIYTDMFLGSLPGAVQSGQLFGGNGNGKTGYITREDCARAAVAALTSSFDGRRTLEITGPEALGLADIAKIVSEVTGTLVTYVPLTREQQIEGMVDAGLPRALAEGYSTFDYGASLGHLDVVTNDFEQLTGRKPQSAADFLAANRDALLQPTTA